MKSTEYKSTCRACGHKHPDYICNWQVQKAGHIQLRPIYADSLWGISAALQSKLNTYKDEMFDYKQEIDCGCRCYVPSDNLEFLEWKYDETRTDF